MIKSGRQQTKSPLFSPLAGPQRGRGGGASCDTECHVAFHGQRVGPFYTAPLDLKEGI